MVETKGGTPSKEEGFTFEIVVWEGEEREGKEGKGKEEGGREGRGGKGGKKEEGREVRKK
jgi:hypothetical protein